MGEFADLGERVRLAGCRAIAREYNAPNYTQSKPLYDETSFAEYFAHVPGLFSPFDDCPKPSHFNPLLTQADIAISMLSRGELPNEPYNAGIAVNSNLELDDFETVSDFVSDWTGDAAEAFKENFLDHQETYTKNQYLMACMVRNAIATEAGLWRNARDSLMSVGEGAITKFDNHTSAGGNAHGDFMIGILGSVVGTALAGFTGVAMIGLAVNVFTTAATTDFEGITAFMIRDEMEDAVQKVRDDLYTEEEKLNRLVNHNFDELIDNRPDYVAELGAWDMVDVPPGEASSSNGLGGRRGSDD
jgi:hypothetical protein